MDPARKRLLAERDHARQQLAALTGDFREIVEASRSTNADDEHDPEGSTVAFERAQVSALVRQVEARLGEVDAALARLDATAYGFCERCGGVIPAARLEARPTARTCVTCPGLR